MRIIVADDEATTRRLLRALLTAAGHEVLEANDGEVAWELLQREGITFLITDWQMPHLDGKSLIQRIRARQQQGYVYTIFLSSRDSKSDLVHGLESGADDYLTKPFHPDELRARVAIGVRILTLEANLREARDAFAYQASHDPLTGLLNRLAITNHVKSELARTDRGGFPLSLALLDLDHFKRINDTYGHLVGDDALCHLAATLGQVVRPYDWLGRWGGEEFLIVLSGTALDDAVRIAERLRTHLAESPLHLDSGQVLSLTASIGVASTGSFGENDIDSVKLFQRADAALYAAKAAGRNCVRS